MMRRLALVLGVLLLVSGIVLGILLGRFVAAFRAGFRRGSRSPPGQCALHDGPAHPRRRNFVSALVFDATDVLARQMIEEGKIGTIRHFRGTYLQDWILDPNFPRGWRLEKARTGSGAMGDLSSHIIDLARYLVGEITDAAGLMETIATLGAHLQAANLLGPDRSA